MEIKVMTYNICSGINNDRPSVRDYDSFAEVIKKINPDIVGLNEVGTHRKGNVPKLEIEGGPAKYLAKNLGMNWYFAKAIELDGCPYGNAILSKYPIKNARTIIIPDAEKRESKGYYETRCILVAELDVAEGITVLVSHFGLMEEEKESAVSEVLSLLKTISQPIIFMGDLNMTPDDTKLKPVFAALNDSAAGAMTPYTWPSDVNNVKPFEKKIKNITGNDAFRKIDYIFSSGHFKAKKIDVYRSLVSDHMPYIVDYSFEAEEKKTKNSV